MATMIRVRGTGHGWRILAWLPLGVLPAVAILVSGEWPPWGRMWALAVTIYAGFKWLTFAESRAARKANSPSFWL